MTVIGNRATDLLFQPELTLQHANPRTIRIPLRGTRFQIVIPFESAKAIRRGHAQDTRIPQFIPSPLVQCCHVRSTCADNTDRQLGRPILISVVDRYQPKYLPPQQDLWLGPYGATTTITNANGESNRAENRCTTPSDDSRTRETYQIPKVKRHTTSTFFVLLPSNSHASRVGRDRTRKSVMVLNESTISNNTSRLTHLPGTVELKIFSRGVHSKIWTRVTLE